MANLKSHSPTYNIDRMRDLRQLYYDNGLCVYGCGRDRRKDFRTCSICCVELHKKYPKVKVNGKDTRRRAYP